MRVVIFCHSLVSDWNHGNAHFLRGIATDMQARGWRVDVYEPHDSWSRQHLLAESSPDQQAGFSKTYPNLRSTFYDPESLDLPGVLAEADLVLVHEWNQPGLVAAIGRHRAVSGRYVLLFHDTHHRSATDPDAMSVYQLEDYDGVLAFGDSISEVYRRHGWGRRVWTWHEAADVRVFYPRTAEKIGDLVWIGNWGDDERTEELQEFLISPVKNLGLRAAVHGVRYPPAAVEMLAGAGIAYAGWLPNFRVPEEFARYRLTVHVPRRPYATALPGVPTIRMFEALACGIPLISAPWNDAEGLFTAGEDYLPVQNGHQMQNAIRLLLQDPGRASAMAEHGRNTILQRHTCTHRVDELIGVLNEINAHRVLWV